MPDFRSERMPSPNGRGVAKGRWQRGWDAYAKAVRSAAGPVMEPAVRPLAREVTYDLIGFYFAWHMYGGYDGLQQHMGMSRSAIYRRVGLFRRLFGAHPDEYVMPGMGLDVAAYLAGRPYGQGPATPAPVVAEPGESVADLP